MRILAAPDCFTGTLTAAQAAAALAEGWRQTKPADEVIRRPLSDGGPGFLDSVLSARSDAQMFARQVTGPIGAPITASFAVAGKYAWIEAAQACGLALCNPRAPRTATSRGVGELIVAAIAAGATDITIGIGGTGSTDGGAGMLAALGATADRPLDEGGTSLRGVTTVDLTAVMVQLGSVQLTVASDVDNPLLGLRGAAAIFGPQKGASPVDVNDLDLALADFVLACGRDENGKDASVALGAGAGGGLGYGLLRIGARRVSGIETVLELLGLASELPKVDLVITGEGRLDEQTLGGKVIMGIAQLAQSAGRPCIALAGDVRLGKRDLAAAGLDGAWAMRDLAGDRALTQAYSVLTELAARVAKSWGRIGE